MPTNSRPPVTLLINHAARRGAALFSQVEAGLKARGFDDVQTPALEKPEQITELAGQAALPGRLVVVGGGDGSVALAAAGLAHTPATLGIVPLGTGNTLARSLNIPLDVNGALDVLTQERRVQLDLTQANGRIFASALTIGLSAQVAAQLTDTVKQRLGLFTYLTLVPRVLLRAHPFKATITTPSQSFKVQTYQFVVVNGRQIAAYLPAFPGSSLTDGVVTGFCLGELSRVQLLGMTLLLAIGQLKNQPEAHYFRSPKVIVETNPIQAVDLDGDVCLRTPVEVSVLPKALNVLVPANLALL